MRTPLRTSFEASRGPGGQSGAVVLQEEDRGRVRLEDLNDPAKQLVEQLLQGQIDECGVGDALEAAQPSPIARVHSRILSALACSATSRVVHRIRRSSCSIG